MIKQWLSRWNKRRDEKEFQSGYEFAAGVLLKSGDSTVIRKLEDRARNPFDYQTKFDIGVLAAIADYEKLLEKNK